MLYVLCGIMITTVTSSLDMLIFFFSQSPIFRLGLRSNCQCWKMGNHWVTHTRPQSAYPWLFCNDSISMVKPPTRELMQRNREEIQTLTVRRHIGPSDAATGCCAKRLHKEKQSSLSQNSYQNVLFIFISKKKEPQICL